MLEKQRKEARKKERQELREEKQRIESSLGQKIDKFDPETMEDEHVTSSTAATAAAAAASLSRHDTPRVAHAQSHDIGHGEAVRISHLRKLQTYQ